MQLKRADDGSAGDAFLDFFDGQGSHHFRIEEEVLLPFWIAGDPKADIELATRVLAEHLELRTAARRLRSGPRRVEQLHELGAALERHVRFEERELFPRIERGLVGDPIAELGEEIARAESGG